MHYFIDTEPFDADDATEQATDELLATPYAVAWAMLKLADPIDGDKQPGRDMVNVEKLCRGGFDPTGRSSHELIAVMASAAPADALRALLELRDRLPDALSVEIDERADELLRERGPVEVA